MEVVLMLLAVPLMMAGGFMLEALTDGSDDDEGDDIAATHQPDSGEPPII